MEFLCVCLYVNESEFISKLLLHSLVSSLLVVVIFVLFLVVNLHLLSWFNLIE